MFAIFVQCGRADHAQLAAGEHRLEHVAGVHGALALAGADNGVQFVEERDDLTVAVLDLLEDGLQPLLELAPVLGTGHHGSEVETDESLAAQALRDVAGDDTLGQTLHNGRLADAWLTDEDRVVLGTAGEDLNHATDLGVSANHGVHFALTRALGEVDAVLFEGLEVLLGVGRRDPPVAAAHGRERRDEALLGSAGLLERLRDGTADASQAGEDVLGGDVLVADRPGDLLGVTQGVDELPRQRGFRDARAGGPGQVLHGAGGGSPHVGRVGADGPQQRGRGRPARVEQGEQEMPRLDRGVAVFGGYGDRGADNLAALRGQTLGVHGLPGPT